MFLSVLNDDEKKIFGCLINKLAHIDGILSEEENELLCNYKFELGLQTLEELDISVEEAINQLSKSSEVVKRAVFLEIVSITLSDEEIKEEENEIMELAAYKFEINDYKEKFIKAVADLQDIYGKIFDLVYID